MVKQCSKCKEEKDETCFSIDKANKSGLRSWCKDCNKKQKKQWNKNNKKKVKKYQQDNKKRIKEYRKKYNKEHYKNNKEEIKELSKKWKEDNREKVNDTRRIYSRNKRKTDIRFRLRNNISSCIAKRLRRRLLSKDNKSIIDFLPYTIDNLKKHLEKQFNNGSGMVVRKMTWDNYGQWHIDHIKPDSLFNYKSVDDKEFQECWALENLQPMWAEENIKKGNKIL